MNRVFRGVLEDGTARCAARVFRFLKELPYYVVTKVIAYQLGKSASLVGAKSHLLHYFLTHPLLHPIYGVH